MIKKMLSAVANNKSALISQDKQAGKAQGKKDAGPQIFSSLLQSMQAKISSTRDEPTMKKEETEQKGKSLSNDQSSDSKENKTESSDDKSEKSPDPEASSVITKADHKNDGSNQIADEGKKELSKDVESTPFLVPENDSSAQKDQNLSDNEKADDKEKGEHTLMGSSRQVLSGRLQAKENITDTSAIQPIAVSKASNSDEILPSASKSKKANNNTEAKVKAQSTPDNPLLKSTGWAGIGMASEHTGEGATENTKMSKGKTTAPMSSRSQILGINDQEEKGDVLVLSRQAQQPVGSNNIVQNESTTDTLATPETISDKEQPKKQEASRSQSNILGSAFTRKQPQRKLAVDNFMQLGRQDGKAIDKDKAFIFKEVSNGQSVKGEKSSIEERTNESNKAVVNSFVKGQKTTTLVEKSIGVSGGQAEQAQKKEEKKRMPSFGSREREAEGSHRHRSESRNRSLNPVTLKPTSSISMGDTSSGATEFKFNFEKDQMGWEGHTTESAEANEGKGTEKGSSAQMRLGQVPISNMALRKRIIPGLTQNVLKASAKANKTPETWQKHNFVLDDGKEIHLSARQVKGVLQLKLGSLHVDLNRLLQQHQQQIREHLKQECGTEIDLQLENNNEQEMSGSFDDSNSSSSKHGRKRNRQFITENTSTQDVGQIAAKSVRSFGYNKMEWTA